MTGSTVIGMLSALRTDNTNTVTAQARSDTVSHARCGCGGPADPRVPLERDDVHQQRARRVRHVGRVHAAAFRAAGQVLARQSANISHQVNVTEAEGARPHPNKPAVDGAKEGAAQAKVAT